MYSSDFQIGDAVVRRWNNAVYYICHDVDCDKQEFLISKTKGERVSKCNVCEMYSNLRHATVEEMTRELADSFEVIIYD